MIKDSQHNHSHAKNVGSYDYYSALVKRKSKENIHHIYKKYIISHEKNTEFELSSSNPQSLVRNTVVSAESVSSFKRELVNHSTA